MQRNETLMQAFEWYLPADGGHWRRCKAAAGALAAQGITAVWLPPAYKGAGGAEEVGYAVYDTYDLGEFDQKGTVATKYGTRQEYLDAIAALHAAGIKVYPDIVLNHRIGADGTEQVTAEESDAKDRNREVTGEETITAYTRFDFPGRGGKYSDFRWNWHHFDGVDWDDARKRGAIYQFAGKAWDSGVDTENGNYDYLMGADLDMGNPEVVAELDRWGSWYLGTTGADGFRLDAVKHIRSDFFTHWLGRLRGESGKPLFAVGEYWKNDLATLRSYLDACGDCMSLFDVPLHFNLYNASHGGGGYDMRTILDGTLLAARPERAVTFVDNHDTQPGQALESWVDGWFKPIAYALILLWGEGLPCVFWGDWYGIPHDGINPVGGDLAAMLRVRSERAYGARRAYLDDPNVIGWTLEGTDDHPGSGIAVVLSDGAGGTKRMTLGPRHAGATFAPVTGGGRAVVLDETGSADFSVEGGSARVYIRI